MKKSNAPVEWIKSENIFVVNLLHPVFISAKAAHPSAARLFVEFCLSKEAQQLLVQLGRKASSRTDIETDVPKTVKFVPEDLSIYDRVNEARADIERLLLR
jgi:ABC-type Fe3+ transport system substrate-binding protein